MKQEDRIQPFLTKKNPRIHFGYHWYSNAALSVHFHGNLKSKHHIPHLREWTLVINALHLRPNYRLHRPGRVIKEPLFFHRFGFWIGFFFGSERTLRRSCLLWLCCGFRLGRKGILCKRKCAVCACSRLIVNFPFPSNRKKSKSQPTLIKSP